MAEVVRVRGASQREVVAGDALLHPVALLAIGLLILNDHVLKQAWPGLVTGKLSDFAGLIFFPLLLQAVWEVAAEIGRRPSLARPRVLAIAILATAAVFAAIKLLPVAGDHYRAAVGWLQWLPAALVSSLAGGDPGSPHIVRLAPDPTDLVALVALAVPWLIGRQRATRTPRP